MTKRQLLLGNEAFALGAIHAGMSGAYAYPGTPSTEILEFVQRDPIAKERGVHSHWSANEKTAVEEALGMSFAGRRAIAAMKHVGLNVAADPFVNSAMTGANGGLIVVAADDPSMHSSQNEQDSRFYGAFARIPVLEPADQQEAYDMAAYGFELSEKYATPVLLRLVTRLAHSRAAVATVGEPAPENPMSNPDKPARWVLMPANSRRRYPEVLDTYNALEDAASTRFTHLTDGPDHGIGIVASGIAWNYVMEAFGGECPYPILKVAQYPIPQKLLRQLADSCKSVMVVEEGQPVIEESLRGIGTPDGFVRGRYTGELPRTGELSVESVRRAFGIAAAPVPTTPEAVTPRPPALCQGCGHRDVFHALNDTLSGYESPKVFGDIGCYTLGYLAPFRAIDTVVDMGASITMAKGASDAGQHPAVAVIGDSTFTHSGMTGLLDAINENSNITVVISDNLTTAMTGGQDSQGTGKLRDICIGLGADPEHVVEIDASPRKVAEMAEVFRREIDHDGLSVIIAARECLQTARRHNSSKTRRS